MDRVLLLLLAEPTVIPTTEFMFSLLIFQPIFMGKSPTATVHWTEAKLPNSEGFSSKLKGWIFGATTMQENHSNC